MGCDAGQLRVAATEGDAMPQYIPAVIMFHRSFMTSMKCGVMMNDLVDPIDKCWQSIIAVSVVATRWWHSRTNNLMSHFWQKYFVSLNDPGLSQRVFVSGWSEKFSASTRFAKEKIISHQDNAPSHESLLAMGKLRDLHYELSEHPPCSPDLVPSGFFLFPKLKLFLAGRRYSSNQEANVAVQEYFADLTKNDYRDGIMALEHRWNKCSSLKGDYVKKQKQF
jgi:hypothetical protein